MTVAADLIICLLIVGFSICFPAYVQAMRRVYQWRRDQGYQGTNYVPQECILGAMTMADILAVIAVFLWIPVVMMIGDLFLAGVFRIFGEDRFLGFLYPLIGALAYLSFFKVYRFAYNIAKRRWEDEEED